MTPIMTTIVEGDDCLAGSMRMTLPRPPAIGNHRLAFPVQHQMNRRHALVAAFVLVLIAGGSVAALFALGRGDEQRAGVSQRQEGSGSTTTPSEREGGAFPIRFLLSDSFDAGATVNVVIENIGSTTLGQTRSRR